jgi:predicted HicB family RNase H-like nuclease
VRVSDEVWAAAAAAAAARGETVSEVIRKALAAYVNAYPADITPGVVAR